MALLFHVSDLPNAILLRCEGRIVCGHEAAELETRIRRLLPDLRCVVLELSGVTFIDSNGLGLLVRLMTSARAAGGELKLAAPSRQVAQLLENTCLSRVLEIFPSPEEALSATVRQLAGSQPTGKCVLCIDPSADVLTFMRTVLQTDGYSVVTTDNLLDARILLRTSVPNLVLLGPSVDPARATETLHALVPALRVLAVDPAFDRVEAAAATTLLLERLRAAA